MLARSSGLAVTPDAAEGRKRAWSVTHERSGLLVVQGLAERDARQVLRRLVEGMDWDRDVADLDLVAAKERVRSLGLPPSTQT